MAEIDYIAARLQLQELQSHYQGLQDSKLALQLFLDSDDSAESSNTLIADAWELSEEQFLQEQIASLSAVLAVAHDQQVALNSIAQEEAQQAASVQLASALEAQEQWETHVLRPHDAALARRIASCNAREWRERGELLQDPLDLSAPLGVRPDGACGPPCYDTSGGYSSKGARLTESSAGPPGTTIDSRSPAHQSFTLDTPLAAGCSGQQGRLDCGICFEAFPVASMIAASLSLPPADAASSSNVGGHCSHKYCMGCMKQYVSCEVQARKVPVCCPNPGCDEELSDADVANLLMDQPQLLQVYQVLEAELLIDQERRLYCPYKDCSTLLERPDQPAHAGDGQVADEQEAPFECPVCHRSFCLTCRIAGWHTGMTCSAFQALPPELKSAEDAALLHIASEKKWKSCPSCHFYVERSLGCNHMVCRCGCHFCYACGVKYVNPKPSARNRHGTQGCNCDLFHVPEEAEQQQVVAPVVLHQANVRPRPKRSGRKISRTRCRYSESIYDCPHGPDFCTFWHDEDDY